MSKKYIARTPVEKTIQAYNRDAESFSKDWHNYDMSKSCDYFLGLMEGDRIIDIGCGTGRDAHYFTRKGYRTTGIDLTPKFLAMSRANAPSANIMKMNMSNLSFHDESFDGAWASGSFCHVPRDESERTLKGIRRVLTKGSPLYLPVEQGIGQKVHEDMLHVFYQEEDIGKLLVNCGFSPLPLISCTGVKGNNWILAFAKAT